MTTTESDDHIDTRQWLPKGESIITPERAAKDDITIERPCTDCDGTGKADGKRCRLCRGQGRILDGRWDRGEIDLSEIGYAHAYDRNVMNLLFCRGVLDAQHVHCGELFELWRVCANADTGYRNNPIYAGEVREAKKSLEGEGLEVADYESLMADLKLYERRIIIYAIETPSSPNNRWQSEHYHPFYRKAFDRLAEVMKRLQDEAKDRKERAETNTCELDNLR